ncbi:MAG: GntR family transcriptional regulator [Phycisphaerae bacterium]
MRGVRETVILRTGLREKVTEQLLTSIFEGRFQAGEQLVVQRIAQMLGVSPTPVREALVELAGLGVVKLIPNHGAVVKPFRREELKEMSQVRRVLESEAARCACGRVDAGALKGLHEELMQLDGMNASADRDRRALAADTALHEMVAESCGSQRLTAEVERYLLLFRALRNISHLRDSWDDYRHTNDVPEHLRIVGALMAGDQEQAAKRMEEHIRSVERSMAVILFGAESAEG